ncbi:MAG: hypothetical protein J7M17_02055 [Anaerolineae bacterium]|nr:hypothetical protein [Anaerolineae bacterium]
MATIEEKKRNRLRLNNYILAALAEGLWGLMGEAAVGLTTKFGEMILKVMEKEMGLELAGESVEDWAAEIGRLYVDEFDAGKELNVEDTGDTITVHAGGCMFQRACTSLQDGGIPPYICPVRAICAAALRRMGEKVRLGEVKIAGDQCTAVAERF